MVCLEFAPYPVRKLYMETNVPTRKWNVNLQKVHMIVDGKPQTLRISARALKTLKAGQRVSEAE